MAKRKQDDHLTAVPEDQAIVDEAFAEQEMAEKIVAQPDAVFAERPAQPAHVHRARATPSAGVARPARSTTADEIAPITQTQNIQNAPFARPALTHAHVEATRRAILNIAEDFNKLG